MFELHCGQLAASHAVCELTVIVSLLLPVVVGFGNTDLPDLLDQAMFLERSFVLERIVETHKHRT